MASILGTSITIDCPWGCGAQIKLPLRQGRPDRFVLEGAPLREHIPTCPKL